MFDKIGAVILLVDDLKRSVLFYRDVLGLQIRQETDDWVEFSKGTKTVLALHPSKKRHDKKPQRPGMLIGFNQKRGTIRSLSALGC